MWIVKILVLSLVLSSALCMFEGDNFFSSFGFGVDDNFNRGGNKNTNKGGSSDDGSIFGGRDSGSLFGSSSIFSDNDDDFFTSNRRPNSKPKTTRTTTTTTTSAPVVTKPTTKPVKVTPTPRPEFVHRAIQRQPVKKSDVRRAKAAIRALVDEHHGENNSKPFNAAILRNSFHDCVGPLGCDGCINHHNVANEGLRRAVDPLDELYESKFFEAFTRADFYALAGITAAESAAALADCKGQGCIPEIKFQYGRLDCGNRLNFTHTFCAFHDDPTDFLQAHFKLTPQEVVAIMGAHSLGRVNRDDGDAWDETPDALDIDYYKQLLQHDWKQAGAKLRPSENMGESWMRVDNSKLLMLGSDIFLVSNINKAFIQTCSSRPLDCPASDLRKFVEEFAKDQKLFISKFAQAYQKVIETGKDKNRWVLNDVIDG